MQKRITLSVLSLCALGAFLGFHTLSGQETAEAYDLSRAAQQGQSISPVTINLKKSNSQLVYLGSYIVNAQGGCNSCHTCPSYRSINPYKGLLPADPTPVNAANYLSGGTPFQSGAITSPNLTPDSTGKPGGMTFAQFQAAMTTGASSISSGHILQVMPWPIFRNMDKNDLHAIYAYLSTIPSAPSGAGQCTAPGQTQ